MPQIISRTMLGMPFMRVSYSVAWLCCQMINTALADEAETGAVQSAVEGAVRETAVVVTGPLQFSETLIKDKYGYCYGVATADLDLDGDFDLTSGDATDNFLYWFQNDGKGGFRQHVVQENDPGWFERHALADINRDGFKDIVIVKNSHGDICWFENPGVQGIGQLWTRHFVTRGKLPGAYDVAISDLDGDGDLDVAGSSYDKGKQFAWFENPDSTDDKEWTKHLIEAALPETRTIRACDIDGDGDPDLVGTAALVNQVIWYENVGDKPDEPTSPRFVKHIIDDRSGVPFHGEPADMDQDGDSDLVMAFGHIFGKSNDTTTHQVAWYENVGNPGRGQEWIRRPIGPLQHAYETVAGDLDGDGDLDVVATAGEEPGSLVWFQNPGVVDKTWERHALKDPWARARQVILVDLNGDRRLDIAAVAERPTLELRWWRNDTELNQ